MIGRLIFWREMIFLCFSFIWDVETIFLRIERTWVMPRVTLLQTLVGKKLEKRCCNYQLKQAYTSKTFHPETDSRIKYSTFQLLHFSLIRGSDNQMTKNVNSIQLPSIHIMVWISIIMICIFILPSTLSFMPTLHYIYD